MTKALTEQEIEEYFQSWKDIEEYSESEGKPTDYVGRIHNDLKILLTR